MLKGICQISIIPLRSGPSSKEEQVNQLLFGETYSVLQVKEDWMNILTDSDNYEGWISVNQHAEWEDDGKVPYLLHTFPFALAIKETNGSPAYLLPGSLLYQLEFEENGRAGFVNNHQKYALEISPADIHPLPLSDLSNFANKFLNAPYLWGGRTMWGIDCSGFTQIIYKSFGIQLPRDAYQQAEVGEAIDFVNETHMGDLAFFENAEGKITHVGMVLGNGEIIHASGRVRKDVLDSYGIFNEKLGKHTHKLRLIKRIIQL